MKKNKRIISAALAASMLLPCFATAAVSANAAVVSDENSVSMILRQNYIILPRQVLQQFKLHLHSPAAEPVHGGGCISRWDFI